MSMLFNTPLSWGFYVSKTSSLDLIRRIDTKQILNSVNTILTYKNYTYIRVVIKNEVIMKKLSITELENDIRKVIKEIENLQDAGLPVPRSLENRWNRLYKQFQKPKNK